jgi:AcrR family transcriptional regulator
VVDTPVQRIASLRERKKARTRLVLINEAIDLCLRHGYENTTIEQISEAADISPRTFNRYFASKDAVFIAVLDDLANEIVAELVAHPSALGPLEELRAAHMAVLSRVAQRPLGGLTAERIVLSLRVVYSSPALRQAAVEYRSEPAMETLANHMGVPVGDRRLELAVALFATAIVSACMYMVTGAPDAPLGPTGVMERLEGTLGAVAHFAAALQLP